MTPTTPAAELETITEIQFTGKSRQSFASHQCRAQACQLALAELRETVIQNIGDDEAQDTVAKKLKALVILTAAAAMG